MHTAFEKSAQQWPGKTAVKESGREITYLFLNTQANYLARLLRQSGAKKETTVAYIGAPGIDLVASLLAIFKSGGVYLPIDIALPVKRIGEMLLETNCRIVMVSGQHKEKLLALGRNREIDMDYLVVIGEDYLEAEVWKQDGETFTSLPASCIYSEQADYGVHPEDGNYIFYTSGSTGSGKPMLGCHKGLSHFINWEIKEFQLDDTCVVSQLSKITFDASLRDIFVPLATGGTLCIPTDEIRSNIPQLVQWIDEQHITVMHIVPSFLRLMNKEWMQKNETGKRFTALKHVLMAGEPLYARDVINWRTCTDGQAELVNLYGTSETTLAKTFHRIQEVPADAAQMMHAGKAIDGAFVAIINNNELCRVGEIGEVYIKTPYRTKGYYNNAALTAQYFVQNPLNPAEQDILHKTGDLGRYLPDRSLEILGRTDDQVKVNGMRVQLSDLEKCMLGCKGVEEAVVIVHKNKDQQNELVGYYTGAHLGREALRSYMAAQLGETIVPGYLIRLEEFPLSPNGKINKKALPKPNDMVISGSDFEAVHEGTEQELEAMWKELLGLDRIGRKASFFTIGGNSLKAIQLISRIYKTYEVLVKINEIFANSTIEQLAAHIDNAARQSFKPVPVQPAQADYELSHAQRRMWAIHQVDETKIAYNVPGAFRIKGALDAGALSASLKALIARHEILRTTFITVNGEPRQHVMPDGHHAFRLNYMDLRQEQDMEAAVEIKVKETVHTPFDLEHGPLFSVTLLHTSAKEYVYVVVMHHIICDALSIDILTKELFQLYGALVGNDVKPLSPLRIHYKDYAGWFNKEMESARFKAHRAYWLGQLQGKLPRLNLPVTHARPAVKSQAGMSVAFTIGKEQKHELEALAQKHNASLFMVCLSLLNTVLYKYTGQEDIVIGSPVAGREHPDLEGQVGLYINTVLLRNTFSGGQPFENLLQHVKKNTLNALRHQAYPFDLLVDALDYDQDRSRNLVFDLGFTYFSQQHVPDDNAYQGLELSELNHHFHLVKADMWVKTVEMPDKLYFILTYSTSLFTASFMEKMVEDMRTMASLIIRQPEATLMELCAAASLHMEAWMEKNRASLKQANLTKLRKLQAQK